MKRMKAPERVREDVLKALRAIFPHKHDQRIASQKKPTKYRGSSLPAVKEVHNEEEHS